MRRSCCAPPIREASLSYRSVAIHRTESGKTLSHYKTNLRDIEFNLFEVLGRDEVLGTGPFAEVDGETAREILAEVTG